MEKIGNKKWEVSNSGLLIMVGQYPFATCYDRGEAKYIVEKYNKLQSDNAAMLKALREILLQIPSQRRNLPLISIIKNIAKEAIKQAESE
jgi:hypothetical protein